jgi:hypothetical protein
LGFASTSDDDGAWVFGGGISLLDVHGTVLWTSGKFVGPSMSGGTYEWVASFNYPAVVRLNHWSTDKPGALPTITPTTTHRACPSNGKRPVSVGKQSVRA